MCLFMMGYLYRFADHLEQPYGCSSIGRVVVSKTIGWEFESLHPCNS
jgi:hypothetical protein